MSPFLGSLKTPLQQETAPVGHARPESRRRRLAVVMLFVGGSSYDRIGKPHDAIVGRERPVV